MLLSTLVAAALAGLPLRASTYDVAVTGPYADLTVEQVYVNDSDEWLAATYVFPLPADAAVDAMTMRIGEVEIVAELQERDEARRTYEEAVASGQAAALTEQERPNVFTQRVGNIPPGASIAVRLHLVQPVSRVEGGWELALPLTVGPRFVPDGVEDAAAITPPVAEHATGHLVDVGLVVDLGRPLAWFESPTHAEAALSVDADGVGVAALVGARPTRDLVVRWGLEVDEPVAAALRQGDHLLLSFEPPERPRRDQLVPRDLIFVIDTSGSQEGVPLQMAKEAMAAALSGLDARDAFALLQFDDSMRWYAPEARIATPDAIAGASAWVEALTAQGGTNMMSGVYGALRLPADPSRERYVVFLTDGYIGNEREVLAALEDLRGEARVFSFGLGSSVNRWLIDEMARSGGGVATVVTLDESPEQAVDRFLDTIARPVLSDVWIDWGGLVVEDVAPERLPDLFAGAPLDVVARVRGGEGPITVRGRVGGGAFEQVIPVTRADRGDARAVATTWARRRIATLEREQHWGELPEVRQAIVDLSLEYDVLTRYTSFVAVQRKVIRREGALREVEQPAELPDGVDFETSVSRPYTPPGDPLLTVDAPEDARAVLVAYPWGETGVLRWDPLRERWFHRFLVPRDVEDGTVEVVIYVLLADGTLQRRVELVHVDGAAPEIEGELHALDGRTRVVIRAEEPLRSLQVYPVGRPDLARRLDLGLDDDAWEHVVELAGEHAAVEVVVKDRAMNTLVEVIR